MTERRVRIGIGAAEQAGTNAPTALIHRRSHPTGLTFRNSTASGARATFLMSDVSVPLSSETHAEQTSTRLYSQPTPGMPPLSPTSPLWQGGHGRCKADGHVRLICDPSSAPPAAGGAVAGRGRGDVEAKGGVGPRIRAPVRGVRQGFPAGGRNGPVLTSVSGARGGGARSQEETGQGGERERRGGGGGGKPETLVVVVVRQFWSGGRTMAAKNEHCVGRSSS